MRNTIMNTEIEQKIKETKAILEMIDKELEHAPEGSLKIMRKADKSYYYHQIKQDNTYEKKYIEKKNEAFAIALARKGYYIKLKPLLEKELRALELFDKSYNEDIADKVYDSMIEARKQIVKPVRLSSREILKKWNEEVYEINQQHQENLMYKTDKGEKVRSKSELIIANMLYRNSKDLIYKYERPLELLINGEKRIFYPDFTVLNIHTGKITYWEHAGMMDNSQYASIFVWKVNAYLDNGIIPGKNLIFTYETTENPINTQYILAMIDGLL